MQQTRRWLIVGFLGLFLVGCGSGARFVRLDPVVYPPKPKNAPVEVHSGGVLTPYVVIGEVMATRNMEATTGALSTYDEVLRLLKEKARQVGGDALIHVQPIQSDNGKLDTRVELRAQVIRYLEKQKSVASR